MSRFNPDCKPCVDAVKAGRHKATSGKNTHDRVYGLVLTALDDTPADDIIWIPAHLSDDQAGEKTCKNGEPMSLCDIRGNGYADKYAKAAVREHRVEEAAAQVWKRQFDLTVNKARWIGQVTAKANHLQHFPFRDSIASKRKALDAATRRRKEEKGKAAPTKRMGKAQCRPVALGGHEIAQV